MPLYDYRCVRGHVTESIQSVTCSVLACAVCQSPANRQAANRVAITAPEVDTRGMFRRFQDATHDLDHRASQREAQGETVTTPNFWKLAKQRAQAIESAGETADMTRKDAIRS